MTLGCYVGTSMMPFAAVSAGRGLRDLPWSLATGTLMAFGWGVGRHVLEVVHTERHTFISLAPQATADAHCEVLLAAMRTPQAPLLQHLAYQDMAALAAASPALAWRRQAMLHSPGGEVTPPSSALKCARLFSGGAESVLQVGNGFRSVAELTPRVFDWASDCPRSHAFRSANVKLTAV